MRQIKPLALDIVWLAGLLEGEGSFKIQTTGGYRGSVCIALQMTDKDTVERAAQLLGGTVWGPHGPYGVSKQQTYQVAIFGSKAASWMMTVFPLMSMRRKSKIKELVTLWKTQPLRTKGRKALCHSDRAYYANDRCKPCARHHRYVTHGD